MSGPEDRALQAFKALANPVRLRIVRLLAERQELSAGQFAAELDIAQSSLFEHLAGLRDAGLILASGESNPTHRYYCLHPQGIAFLQAVIGGWSHEGDSTVHDTRTGIAIRTATAEDGGTHVIAEEYAVMDRAGRVQIPREYREALELTRRVRLALETDHVTMRPDA